AVAVSPDGLYLAVAVRGEKVRLYDLRNLDATPKVMISAGGITGMGFAPDSNTLATSHYEGPVRLWKVPSGTEAGPRAPSWHVGCLAFAPNGGNVAIGADKAPHLQLWNVNTMKAQAVDLPPGYTRYVAFTSDSQLLWTYQGGKFTWTRLGAKPETLNA